MYSDHENGSKLALVLLAEAALYFGGLDVVERERYLLVVQIFVVGVVVEVGALLGRDDAPHQLNGGVLLAAVAVALALDGNLGEEVRLGHEADVDVGGGVLVDVD